MPQERYSGHTVTEKSRNNHEINFLGSESKIVIGNGTSVFNPRLTFHRWNEVNFTLDLPSQVAGNLGNGALLNNKVSFDNSNYGFSFTPTPPKEGFNELGGLDFIITLKKKPPTNILNFTYSSSGVEAYLQPPLTQEMKIGEEGVVSVTETDAYDKDGDVIAHRPDYVVNSVAFYATGKAGDYTALGGKNYKSGKFGHLYRLKAVDNLGKWAWCDWNVSGNTISLTCPQSFLNSASYPVSLMPSGDTFGVIALGGSSSNTAAFKGPTASQITYTPAAAGTATSMSIGAKIASGSCTIKGAIYDNAASPNLIANSPTGVINVNSSTRQFWSGNTGAATLTAVPYYLVVMGDNTWYASGQLAYDTGASDVFREHNATDWPTFPNSFAWTNNAYKWIISIYCTYTPTGGGTTYELSITDGIKASDTPTPQLTIGVSITDGIKNGDTPIGNGTFPKSITDGIKSGDAALANTIFQSLITDGVKAGDTASTKTIFQSLITDGVKNGDSALTQASLQSAITDGIKAGDTAIFDLLFQLLVTEGIKNGDSAQNSAIIQSSITDALKVSDNAAAGLLWNLAISEGIKLSDMSLIDVIRIIKLISAILTKFQLIPKTGNELIMVSSIVREYQLIPSMRREYIMESNIRTEYQLIPSYSRN